MNNTESTKKSYYVIKSIYMTRYLQRAGFELKKVAINKFNPIHNVYMFEDTIELRNAMKRYSDKQRELGYYKG